jgi:hypothetical protein
MMPQILFFSEGFNQKLIYFVDIFEKLLNKSMQVQLSNNLTQNDKVNAFIKRLEMWKINTERNTLTCLLLP